MAEVALRELVLNVPGLSETEAKALARGLAQRLADRLDPNTEGRLGRVEVNLPAAGLRGSALADWIADRVLGALP